MKSARLGDQAHPTYYDVGSTGLDRTSILSGARSLSFARTHPFDLAWRRGASYYFGESWLRFFLTQEICEPLGEQMRDTIGLTVKTPIIA